MTQAKNGDRVKVHYTGRFSGGEVFDSSVDQEPFEFTLGEGQVIPGFESAIVGMEAGQTKTTQIAPDQAYGPRQEELVVEVDRTELPAGFTPKVGQQLQFPQQDGGSIVVRVSELSDATITLDANHPLAGKDLEFEIELLEIAS